MRDGKIIANVSAGSGQFPVFPLKELTLLNTGVYQCGVKLAVSNEIIKSEGVTVSGKGINYHFLIFFVFFLWIIL